MDATELLQTIGLTKYEAEAYTALLREGPLTGYELGKRSAVPLPRIYDVLKRLVDRGLVLTRPGDPPLYRAADPAQFINQVRSTIAETLDTVTELLADLPREDRLDGVWIVQTREIILAHAASLIQAGRRSIELLVRASPADDIEHLLALAAANRDRPSAIRHVPYGRPEQVALLIDDHQALLATISPPDRCQAIVSAHAALVAAVRAYVRRDRAVEATSPGLMPASRAMPAEWIAWEEEKQRRLLRTGRSVA